MQILNTTLKARTLIFFGVLILAGQFRLSVAKDEITDMKIDFLEGEVQIIEFNHEITRFRIVENNAVVDVRNDIHLRLVDNPHNLPKVFPIISPMTAVYLVDGEIPSSYIKNHSLKYYLLLKQKYEANAQSPAIFTSGMEKIINKDDADYIFGLTRVEWEKYAKRMIPPNGWKIRLLPHDTGTGVMSFDPNIGIGFSVQPLYDKRDSPPAILIVGSYYPIGSLPEFSEDFKKKLEIDAATDLGSTYAVSASYTKTPPFEGIELTVTKK